MKKYRWMLFVVLATALPTSSFASDILSYEISDGSIGSYMFKEIPLASMLSSIGTIAAKDGYSLELGIKNSSYHKKVAIYANMSPWTKTLEDIAFRYDLKLKLNKNSKNVYISE
ncbi:MAG: hypothetical protein AB9Q22_12725 [Candidatus Reddybacter sp.]